ncbi:GntR family transcriptional repressor for pyruvate dehydrogenase complex [Arthrobacter sp. CAN_A214]|uniref:FadR/GntR family transcriptional regulator n=1 Tax=Arthrobacter sp. CAN_A214 TaxID=2787720 RepID=UPI0018CAD298
MSSLTATVVENIRQQIIDGDIRPGDKLPAESALEEQFSVSRTVVREAISRLHAAGLVETYRGKGTYVLTRPSTQAFAADPENVRTFQDRLDLLDFRLGTEVEAAALAARRRTPTQLAAIDRALGEFIRARDLPSNAVEADFSFHRNITIASNNRFYLDLLTSLGPTMISMPQTRLMQPDTTAQRQHFDRVIEEHRTIADAIDREDPQSAAAAMRTHLANSRVRLLPAMKTTPA